VQDTVKNIVKRIEKKLVYEYTNNIYLKPGVLNYLKKLRDEGTSLYVLTASPHIVTDACLRHNGVQGTFHWFDQVWSVEDFGLSKSSPEIFYEVAKRIGCEVGDIHYFDDSLIALKNARAAGYINYGVYDAQTPDEVETMKALSDTVVMSFEDLL
jgi:FMN phosphatase YigB (HAD superfamily)